MPDITINYILLFTPDKFGENMVAKVQRSEIIQNLIDIGRLDVSRDKVPDVLDENLKPVIIINDLPIRLKFPIVRSGNTTTSGTNTIYTTPSDRDFYLTGATLSNQSNSTADNTAIQLNITPFGDNTGAVRSILTIAKQTTTAINETISISINPPIRLARNVAINTSSTFTVGASTTTASIIGFEELL